jgi:hypothetical protein
MLEHVELDGAQIALPADHVQGMPREEEGRELTVSLHAHLEFTGLIVRVGVGYLEDTRIELGVAPHQAALGKVILARSFDDEEEVVLGLRYDTVRCSLGDYQVVALLIGEGAVVRLDHAAAPVHEVANVAVGIAQEVLHRLVTT